LFISKLSGASKNVAQDPAGRTAAAARGSRVSVGVNLIMAVTQTVVGIMAGSHGLIADAIRSLSCLVADLVLRLARQHRQQQAGADQLDERERLETAASLLLGSLLLSIGLGLLWSAARQLEAPETAQTVHIMALWVAAGALITKELLFRYLRSLAKQVKSGLLVANTWYARPDGTSSLLVCVGIIGNLAGYPILDPLAALILGFMVTRMGWRFGWEALHELMDARWTSNAVRQFDRH
jgi:cation diffusion facilitator family transporter